MVQVNVPEIQLDSTSRFGEGSDEEIGSERDSCGNGGLTIHRGVFAEDNDFSWRRHHKCGCHWRRGFPLHGAWITEPVDLSLGLYLVVGVLTSINLLMGDAIEGADFC